MSNLIKITLLFSTLTLFSACSWELPESAPPLEKKSQVLRNSGSKSERSASKAKKKPIHKYESLRSEKLAKRRKHRKLQKKKRMHHKKKMRTLSKRFRQMNQALLRQSSGFRKAAFKKHKK